MLIPEAVSSTSDNSVKTKTKAEKRWYDFIHQPLGNKSLAAIPKLDDVSTVTAAFEEYNRLKLGQQVTKVSCNLIISG